MSASSQLSRKVSSFGFSGAGFLTCYHLGVAEGLIHRGVFPGSGEIAKNEILRSPVILTGVSGGALVAAAISVGIRPVDGMNAMLDVAEHTRKAGGLLDHLHPGFSLVDEVEERMVLLMRDLDEEFILRRIQGGRLRIGLTDIHAIGRLEKMSGAYVYVDRFESLGEIISACILSSYIPGLTGPLSVRTLERKGAVRRASETMNKMLSRRAVKDCLGFPLENFDDKSRRVEHNTGRIRFLDGGLANVFPVIDASTCIVTPFAGSFINPTISPNESAAIAKGVGPSSRRPMSYVENARVMRYVSFSSKRQILENFFEVGFNNAIQFLSDPQHLHSPSSLIERISDKTVFRTKGFKVI